MKNKTARENIIGKFPDDPEFAGKAFDVNKAVFNYAYLNLSEDDYALFYFLMMDEAEKMRGGKYLDRILNQFHIPFSYSNFVDQ